MADKRQQILNAVKTRLQTIATPTYRTNVGTQVYLERAVPFADEELPAINISDGGSPVIDELYAQPANVWNQKLHVKIEIECSGVTTGNTVRQIKEDIKQAIGTDLTWSALAQYTEPVSDFTKFEHKELFVAEAYIEIDILYQTNQWDSD